MVDVTFPLPSSAILNNIITSFLTSFYALDLKFLTSISENKMRRIIRGCIHLHLTDYILHGEQGRGAKVSLVVHPLLSPLVENALCVIISLQG